MEKLKQKLKKTPTIYAVRDIERTLGLDLDTEGYHIISNDTAFARETKKKRKNVLLIKEKEQLDTNELLNHPDTKKYLEKITNPNILVFKNSKLIEKTCARNGWNLLNPPAELANEIEDKITQTKWLGRLKSLLPKHQISKCKNAKWRGEKFILQFNKAHTGSGTILIESESELQKLQQKFPERPVRITNFVEGPVFTSNIVVSKKKILPGNISYQITGLEPFTKNKFATIGNDWALSAKILTPKTQKQYANIVQKIGKKMQKNGWRGLFGIDAILDEKKQKIYLLEINARQPASTTFESYLQNPTAKHLLTTFEAHMASLLEIEIQPDQILKQISSGAQILLRNSDKFSTKNITKIQKQLCSLGLNLIQYENNKPDSELLRIQTEKSFMKNYKELNELGKKIKQIILSL